MPDLLQVQHVIFTRVERAYSPKNASGYQIVYQSSTLGREVAQIEQRVQCFEADKGGNERYQFFWTERGQAVLTRSIPLLQPDSEVIDHGQRDAFLAHALVIDRDEFANCRNDPFALIEAAEQANLFVDDVEQLVDVLRGKEPARRLNTPRRKPAEVGQLLENWEPEELWQLYRLGLRAPELSQRGQSLLVLAENPNDVYVLLSLMLMLIPPNERAACTFDTHVDGCYPQAGAFWVLGSSRGKNHPGLLPIRLSEQRLAIKGGDDGFPDPKALIRAARLPAGYAGCARKAS